MNDTFLIDLLGNDISMESLNPFLLPRNENYHLTLKSPSPIYMGMGEKLTMAVQV